MVDEGISSFFDRVHDGVTMTVINRHELVRKMRDYAARGEGEKNRLLSQREQLESEQEAEQEKYRAFQASLNNLALPESFLQDLQDILALPARPAFVTKADLEKWDPMPLLYERYGITDFEDLQKEEFAEAKESIIRISEELETAFARIYKTEEYSEIQKAIDKSADDFRDRDRRKSDVSGSISKLEWHLRSFKEFLDKDDAVLPHLKFDVIAPDYQVSVPERLVALLDSGAINAEAKVYSEDLWAIESKEILLLHVARNSSNLVRTLPEAGPEGIPYLQSLMSAVGRTADGFDRLIFAHRANVPIILKVVTPEYVDTLKIGGALAAYDPNAREVYMLVVRDEHGAFRGFNSHTEEVAALAHELTHVRDDNDPKLKKFYANFRDSEEPLRKLLWLKLIEAGAKTSEISMRIETIRRLAYEEREQGLTGHMEAASTVSAESKEVAAEWQDTGMAAAFTTNEYEIYYEAEYSYTDYGSNGPDGQRSPQETREVFNRATAAAKAHVFLSTLTSQAGYEGPFAAFINGPDFQEKWQAIINDPETMELIMALTSFPDMLEGSEMPLDQLPMKGSYLYGLSPDVVLGKLEKALSDLSIQNPQHSAYTKTLQDLGV
ncbi:MAG: hypothetical protein GC136_02470 [Alphaproteobacteria bacterium]|nr:hypothetical protein [Alphaproteobacteria bacterium]